MNKNEFKPCPFCGGKAKIDKIRHSGGFGEGYDNWLIKCEECPAKMEIAADNFYEREYYTEEEAIAMWNNRKE